jgi:hypothetical protein
VGFYLSGLKKQGAKAGESIQYSAFSIQFLGPAAVLNSCQVAVGPVFGFRISFGLRISLFFLLAFLEGQVEDTFKNRTAPFDFRLDPTEN